MFICNELFIYVKYVVMVVRNTFAMCSFDELTIHTLNGVEISYEASCTSHHQKLPYLMAYRKYGSLFSRSDSGTKFLVHLSVYIGESNLATHYISKKHLNINQDHV